MRPICFNVFCQRALSCAGWDNYRCSSFRLAAARSPRFSILLEATDKNTTIARFNLHSWGIQHIYIYIYIYNIHRAYILIIYTCVPAAGLCHLMLDRYLARYTYVVYYYTLYVAFRSRAIRENYWKRRRKARRARFHNRSVARARAPVKIFDRNSRTHEWTTMLLFLLSRPPSLSLSIFLM